jgi:hypothetical protein
VLIDSNRLPSFLPSGPPSIRISGFKDVVKKWNWWFFYRWRRPTVNKDSLLSQGNEILFIALLLFFALVKAGENSLKLGQSFLIFFAYKWQLKGTYNYGYTYGQISGSQGCRITRALESWVMSLVTCWFPLNASKLMSVHHSCLDAFIEDRCSNVILKKEKKKKGQFSRIRVGFVTFFF